MQSRYFFLSFLFLLFVSQQQADAQNTPTTETSVPSSVSAINVPDEVSISGDVNYIRSYAPVIPIASSTDVISTSPASQVQQSIAFKDGFNRTFQTVQQQVSMTGGQARHLVQLYDLTPKQDQYSFLPYASNSSGLQSDAFHAQRNYYSNKYPDEGYTAYDRTSNNAVAGERSVTSYEPGKSQIGQSRGVFTKKVSNLANEVRIWTLNASGLPVSPGYYGVNELFGEESRKPSPGGVISVSSPTTRTFVDRDGRVVLKMVADSNYTISSQVKIAYQSTYYVYNNVGQLSYILSPRAVELIESAGWIAAQDVLDNLCFRYRYDKRARKIEQKEPGKGRELYVYDKLGRLCFYQDSIMRVGNKWLFTIYDGQRRPACTGFYTSTTETQTILQGYFYDSNTYPAPNLIHYLKDYNLKFDYNIAPPGVEILTYSYYDNYQYNDPTGAFWNTNSSNGLLSSDLQTTPGAETPSRSDRIKGLPTGTLMKIQPSQNGVPSRTGEWRLSSIYYDDKGRVIYNVSQTLYQGNVVQNDYTSSQYDFTGKLLISKHVHTNNSDASGTTTHTEWTKNAYDPTTMALINSKHKVDDGYWNILCSYNYDEMGRVSRKTLGNNSEVQDLSYNIRGQLTGINAVYAETGSKESLSRTFGESLKYDYGFSQPRYDNRIAGVIWRGSSNDIGSSITRNFAYGYDYDQSGRLKRADFRVQVNTGASIIPWSNSNLDYSVANLFYDKNGNILSMKQRGTQPGTGPVNMDVMGYRYANNTKSNQLIAVTDAGVADYGAGDFQNGTTGTADDYGYDGNGNLKKDLNKNITDISYTFLDKPQRINYGTGNAIEYSYDAAGNKAEELVKVTGQPDKRTDYQGNFIYRNDSLQYVLTSEGRTLVGVPGDNPVKEEYFVKDHLGNVRSTVDVITYLTKSYLATWEIASANLEGLLFDNLNEVRDNKPGSTDPNDASSGRLNGAEPDHRVGTSLLLKVMAGDKIALNVNNYYDPGYKPDDDQPINPDAMLASVVSTLTGGQGGFEGSESHDTKIVDNLFSTENYAIFQTLTDNNTDVSKPRAYLNYVFFDENMTMVSQASGAFQANGNGTWATIGTSAPLVMPLNGFLAVYLSNSSNIVPCPQCGNVFFDQLLVEVSKGNLLEENHYYPHGLPIAGLSAQTTTDFKEQRYRYQSNEYIKDLGLNWMDFQARQYDPQIGRFLNVDPLADAEGQEIYSPYAAMGNMPESMVDPNGEQQINFAQATNGMNDNAAVESSFKNAMDAAMAGTLAATMSGGGGPSWGGMSGMLLAAYLKTQSKEKQAEILGQINGTGAYIANFDSKTTFTVDGVEVEDGGVVIRAKRPGFFGKLWKSIKKGTNDALVWIDKAFGPGTDVHDRNDKTYDKNGGGIEFTGSDGQNEEGRKVGNPDKESVNVDNMMFMFGNGGSGVSWTSFNEKLEKISFYLEGITKMAEVTENLKDNMKDILPKKDTFIILQDQTGARDYLIDKDSLKYFQHALKNASGTYNSNNVLERIK